MAHALRVIRLMLVLLHHAAAARWLSALAVGSMIFMTPRTGFEGQGTWGMWGSVGLGCHFEGGLVTPLGVLRDGRGCHPRFSGVQNGEGEAASAVASAGEVDDVGEGAVGIPHAPHGRVLGIRRDAVAGCRAAEVEAAVFPVQVLVSVHGGLLRPSLPGVAG